MSLSLPPDLLALCTPHEVVDKEKHLQTIKEAIEQQKSPIRSLLDSDDINEKTFLYNLSNYLGFPWWDEPIKSIPAPVREKFSARLALRYHLIPLLLDDGKFAILTYDPFDLTARQVVNQVIPEEVIWVMSSRKQILEGLRQGYGIGAETFEEILEAYDQGSETLEIKQETNILDADDGDEASVVRFVNQIFREALEQKATDVHIEPLGDDLRIRYRIDGVLHEVPVPEQIKSLQSSLISRMKIMAHLDIAERRLPQDGRINLELEGEPIDVRVATIPSVAGESVSMRLLGQEKFDFERLSMTPDSEKKIRSLLDSSNGIILVTGPTGCGKSTSLYTFLSSLNNMERRIVTIEDPVEHKLPGIIQIAIKPDINLTFANSLRSVLRGDPNVIMVGEMRDFETAEIAIRAALTGHLVFSTLHTNDAIGAITRLIDMGIEPFLIASSVRAFLAQRLVRVLCKHCSEKASYPEDYLKKIGFPMDKLDKIRKGKGCDHCHHKGYQGRMAIFEICSATPRLQNLITKNSPAGELRAMAIEEGMIPLRSYGWDKVTQGETTIEEIMRVTQSEMSTLDE